MSWDLTDYLREWITLPFLSVFLAFCRVRVLHKRVATVLEEGRVWSPSLPDALLIRIFRAVKVETAEGVMALLGAAVVGLAGRWLVASIMVDIAALQVGQALPQVGPMAARLALDIFRVMYQYVSPTLALWALRLLVIAGVLGALRASWSSFREARSSRRSLYDACGGL